MSDLVGNHIVGFPTRRLICDSIWHFGSCGVKVGNLVFLHFYNVYYVYNPSQKPLINSAND